MTAADYILSVIGLCLGTFAALFPWHVYLHPESYGPPRMTFSRDGVCSTSDMSLKFEFVLSKDGSVFDSFTLRKAPAAGRRPAWCMTE